MTSDSPTVIRAVRPTDTDALIDFLIRGRAHISGCRDRAVFRAFIHDSFGPEPRTTVAVARDPD